MIQYRNNQLDRVSNVAGVFIYLIYQEEGADVEPAKGEDEPIHWVERPVIDDTEASARKQF